MNRELKDKQDLNTGELIRDAELRSGGQIISMISHEMRTPLSIISSNVQLLKSFAFNLDDELVNDTFLLCEEAVRSLTSIIDEICFLNTVYKSNLKVNPERVCLVDLLNEVVARCCVSDFDRSRIEIEQTSALDFICTDKDLFKRCLINLVKNALSFSTEKIRVITNLSGNELVVTIVDRGIGIPDADKEHVFEPFRRGGNVPMVPGCGIGLAVVKACVDILGGKVGFASEQNRGTEFILMIRNHECKKSIDY